MVSKTMAHDRIVYGFASVVVLVALSIPDAIAADFNPSTLPYDYLPAKTIFSQPTNLQVGYALEAYLTTPSGDTCKYDLVVERIGNQNMISLEFELQKSLIPGVYDVSISEMGPNTYYANFRIFQLDDQSTQNPQIEKTICPSVDGLIHEPLPHTDLEMNSESDENLSLEYVFWNAFFTVTSNPILFLITLAIILIIIIIIASIIYIAVKLNKRRKRINY